MEFSADNIVFSLCAQGMESEGEPEKAAALFFEAWSNAQTDFEKFTAAHYVARQQESIHDKLIWDERALQHALLIRDEPVGEFLPSLYLNIAKCHEDLGDRINAKKNYEEAFSACSFLPDNGYGNMIKSGVKNGLERINK